MEETVWLYFSVVAVLIGFAVIGTVFKQSTADNAVDQLFVGVEQLRQEADLVCKSPAGTMLSIKIVLPSGALLYSKENKLCGTMDDKIKCVPTLCVMQDDPELLNLTSEATRKLFKTHEFTCAFEKQQAGNGDITIAGTCQG